MTDASDAFFDRILSDHSPQAGPTAFYNPEGDCIQFLTRPETYRGKRINADVTVYLSLETGEVIGATLKGVRALLKKCNALMLVINDKGLAHVEQLLFLGLWLEKFSEGDVRVPLCRQVLQMAKKSDLECDVSHALAAE